MVSPLAAWLARWLAVPAAVLRPTSVADRFLESRVVRRRRFLRAGIDRLIFGLFRLPAGLGRVGGRRRIDGGVGIDGGNLRRRGGGGQGQSGGGREPQENGPQHVLNSP